MRLSIRYQVLAVISILVIASVGTYVVVATDYIIRDKLAYIYDLNASLAHTRAQEIEAALETLTGKLRFIAAAQYDEARTDKLHGGIWPLFGTSTEVAALEIWERRESRFVQTFQVTREPLLAQLEINAADLVLAHRQAGITPEVVVAEGVLLRNTSVATRAAVLTLALASDDGRGVLIADLDPSALVRLLDSSELYRTFLVDARGQLLASADRQQMIGKASLADRPSVHSALRSATARGVGDQESPDGPVVAAFARLSVGRLAVVTEIPRARALLAADELRHRSLLLCLLAVALTILAAVFFSRRVARRLDQLRQAATKLGAGELGHQVEVGGGDEIAALTRTFNEMSTKLATRDTDLQHAYAQLQQADRMALLGTVTAGVAHEIKNPVAYATLAYDYVKEFVAAARRANATVPGADLQAVEEALADLGQGLGRIKAVSEELGQMSRSQHDVKLAPVSVTELLDKALKMAAHQVVGRARVVREFGDVPPVRANGTRLGQVFLNLIVNAAQALQAERLHQNEIRLRTFTADGMVVVEVADNGPGLTPEASANLFREFFTTKQKSGGTGLGLPISRQIVEELDGRIEVDTAVGAGATFRVLLPAVTTTTARGP